MNSECAWNTIIIKLKGKYIELPTVPKTRKTPLWFSATTDGNKIIINRSINNKPSCQLSVERRLTYSIFEKVYPIYLRREKGEQVSYEATATTLNQVYFFSVIKHLCQ